MTALPSNTPTTSSRRSVLQGATAGLVIGFVWSGRSGKAQAAPTSAPFAPNAFVRIAPDNTVTVLIKHLEMGQGVYTGLTTIVAEELDADWSQMRAEHAPAIQDLYKSTRSGVQMTGGSTSIANSYDQLRKAGATARAMLVSAAAKQWNVPAAEIRVENGVLSYKNKRATFGELAMKAAALPVPQNVALKDPATFKLIGRDPARLDTPSKVDGSAQYGIDVNLPGMLRAVVARPPRFRATVKNFNADAVRAMPGVKYAFAIPSGVAVVADSFWQAQKARSALQIEWDETNAETRGTTELMAGYKKMTSNAGSSARNDGDANAALAAAKRSINLEFEFPYLAHAPMEPLDCVMRVDSNGCEIWAGSQFQTVDQGNVGRVLGLTVPQVKINTVFAGGSFGRRANAFSDYLTEAAYIVKELPQGTPVKVVWTREDDIRGGMYRPMYYHSMRASLNAEGKIDAWKHTIVGQAILKGTPFESSIKDGVDGSSVEGAQKLPYEIPNFSVELHTPDTKVPVLWWRSVGSTHNAYATEVLVDQLAKAANTDPLEFRRAHASKHPRHIAALNLAAEKAEWTKPLGPNRARGIAVAEAFGTVAAQVVEISRDKDGKIKVDRVVCAVDCGVVINPNIIATQMEGGVAYGLGAILRGEITMTAGRVDQSNFDTYGVLRMDEMPVVDVYTVPSENIPSGVGELGVPALGPALANAIFALTGKVVTKLPMASSVAV